MNSFKYEEKKRQFLPVPIKLLLLISTGLFALMLFSIAISGEDQAKVEPTKQAESLDAKPQSDSPSIFKSIGNFFSGSSSTKSKDESDKIDKADSSSTSSSTSGGFSLIDIDTWSNVSNVVLDPVCKQPIQPFGITDNVASLGILTAKLKVKGFLDGFSKNGQPSLVVKDIIKLAARNLNWMPMDFEKQIGESKVPEGEVLAEDKNKDIKKTYAQAREILADILKNVPENNPYEFKIIVVKSSFGNATALPGGIILVDRDLFKKGTPPEYPYFVIAHEVSHVLQRHQTRAYQARLADGIDSLDNFRKLLGDASHVNPGAALEYASALKNMIVNYSEQQELQADSCAIRFMKTKYPEQKMILEKMVKVEQKLGPITLVIPDDSKDPALIKQLQFLGDGVLERHPNTKQRKDNFQVTIKAIYT
ncbi:M48 family metalloprotease [Undibacterium sp. 5I1]|uniref:M48 family metalloprotease n=1 Tax=unclassified Undibacterium TaxID=2630295 RepID=UPI002AB3464C|nr:MULTISPECIES: M48 family metalloprotease [unclassified Undibacterium]MDY7537881.1 M48 family metalloprotease [Undibacterium sp. 5I1]MEB0230357.1 M48 family metalloprotease [Undibacterium sp. 10I3]MEB0259748.1 M48 family metalloprotease [Undibacterium sp. 5I1]